MRIGVKKIDGEYKVEFWIENQGFTLEYGGTKTEANWQKKMLQMAFKNHKKIILKESSKPEGKKQKAVIK